VFACEAFDIRHDWARVCVIVEIIPLVAMTAFIVLGVLGTVGKLMFDDWRVRQAMRLPVPVVVPVPRIAATL
jgi:hypothetical protein